MVEENDEKVLLSESEVNYVLDFARNLGDLNYYGNALTPLMLNARMRDINLSPVQATEDTLNAALKNPKENEQRLLEFSQDFENQSQVYKKLLSYLGTMLDFSLTYSCVNAKYADYSSNAYRKDLDVLKKFVTETFDYKNEFSKVVQELLRNEAYFCSTRQVNNRLILQELPANPQYTLINGRWSENLLFAFNMYWFLQPGVDINLYDDFFKQKYFELWGSGKGIPQYSPSLPPELRGESSWIYWQDMPIDNSWCWKFNEQIATRVPYYSGLFLDLIQQPQMRALQKNINMAAAAKILIGEIPLLANAGTAAKVKDSFSISANNLGAFLGLVKSAIGDAIKTAAVPLTNVQSVNFAGDNELYSSYLKTALATSGVNSNLIFTSNVRPNSIESQLSLNVDEAQMTALYPSFEKFMNYKINKLVSKYKFKIKFQGTQFYNNRQQRFDKQMQLAGLGIILPQEIAASINMNPFEFQSQLEEAQSTGWTSKLTPIISAFQQSGSADSGAPKKSDGDISDAGEQTRDSGGNIGRGGKST